MAVGALAEGARVRNGIEDARVTPQGFRPTRQFGSAGHVLAIKQRAQFVAREIFLFACILRLREQTDQPAVAHRQPPQAIQHAFETHPRQASR